jgi:hypothetical protein
MATHSTSRRNNYGKIKQAVVEAHAAGLTYADVQAKYGYRRASLYEAARHLNLKLKPSKHRT